MDAESDEEGEYSGDERMDEGATEDSEDEIYAGSELSAEERTRLRTLKQQVASQESYATVKWTLNQLLLHETLRDVPVETWTDETIQKPVAMARGVSSPELNSRAVDFVFAVRRDASVGEALPIPLGSELLNDDRLLKLKMHCKKIHRELDAAKNYIVMTLTLIANNEGLSLDMAPNEVVISPAGVDGVWLSDNLISDGIETKFQSEVALLENVPDDEKDWHPGSMKQVLDLVIVKIAEIVLTPDNSKYKGGSWHMEGTSAEKIVGTGIYYFDCENIKESFLCFRAEVDEPPYQQDDKDGVAAIYGLFDDALLVQDVGSVQSVESRCVAFPNSLQHQVRPFELKDPNKPGVRKILAFFLVDPETPIPSTSVIPPQQRKWIDTKLEFLAETLQLVDRVEQNIRSMLNSGMPLLEAKQNRLDLMEERAAAVEEADEQSSGSSRYFSLCEH
ncbi:hypothetical protein BBP00_00009919 [Phytophthora kernoviae]|uniref:DUF4246 domain-containing protein n=1 Tax=Phytophthora kernoviae TaxID=325452 RepID=A0A3F2RB95_9STRA|nr:hypothetical protein BBP00_00009919 [Phytophthora kernoviae]